MKPQMEYYSFVIPIQRNFHYPKASRSVLIKHCQHCNSAAKRALLKSLLLSDKEMKMYSYPYQSAEEPGKTFYIPNVCEENDNTQEIVCSRCHVPIIVDGESLSEQRCNYHIYRCRSMSAKGGNVKKLYTCCNREEDAPGCRFSFLHMFNARCLKSPFVSTKRKPDLMNHSSIRIYSLKCQMCCTSQGLEVARVSVVKLGGVIYDEYVLPDAPIIDYMTAVSGITAQDLESVTLRLSDVQYDLLEIFDSEAIIVGHGLEKDLKALRIIHEKIIDIAVVFPHKQGWPYRRSLPSLAEHYLGLPDTIHKSDKDQNSIRDASNCLKLLSIVIHGYVK